MCVCAVLFVSCWWSSPHVVSILLRAAVSSEVNAWKSEREFELLQTHITGSEVDNLPAESCSMFFLCGNGRVDVGKSKVSFFKMHYAWVCILDFFHCLSLINILSFLQQHFCALFQPHNWLIHFFQCILGLIFN